MAKSDKKKWPTPQFLVAVLFVCLILGAWVFKKQSSTPPSSLATNQPTEVKFAGESKTKRFESKKGDLLISSNEEFFVTETVQDQDGWTEGYVTVSLYSGEAGEGSNLGIRYGIPYIDGKGGACVDNTWKKERILSQNIDVCEGSLGLHGGYPKNPNHAIEYAFYIGGDQITVEEFKLYKEILLGLSYLP